MTLTTCIFEIKRESKESNIPRLQMCTGHIAVSDHRNTNLYTG